MTIPIWLIVLVAILIAALVVAVWYLLDAILAIFDGWL